MLRNVGPNNPKAGKKSNKRQLSGVFTEDGKENVPMKPSFLRKVCHLDMDSTN